MSLGRLFLCLLMTSPLCICVFLQISDSLQESYATSEIWQFLSLGYALMLCPFVIVLGGMFFLATALFFLDDRDKAAKEWVPLPLLRIFIHSKVTEIKALLFEGFFHFTFLNETGFSFPISSTDNDNLGDFGSLGHFCEWPQVDS